MKGTQGRLIQTNLVNAPFFLHHHVYTSHSVSVGRIASFPGLHVQPLLVLEAEEQRLQQYTPMIVSIVTGKTLSEERLPCSAYVTRIRNVCKQFGRLDKLDGNNSTEHRAESHNYTRKCLELNV